MECLNWLTTSVGCLPNICITELSTLFQAGIHFMWATHWNSYSKQIENINILLIENDKFTQREQMESPPQLHYRIPFSLQCTRGIWMFLLLPDKRGKSWSSRGYQIIWRDLLFGILVVDTGGRVQNIEILEKIKGFEYWISWYLV